MKLSQSQRDYVQKWLQEQLEIVTEELQERKHEGLQSAQQMSDATWLKRFLESGLRKLARESNDNAN